MSLILEKRVFFLKECQQFRKKGSFLRHFHWKLVIYWCFMSAFFNKRGPFFLRISFNLENDNTSPLLRVSGWTGVALLVVTIETVGQTHQLRVLTGSPPFLHITLC